MSILASPAKHPMKRDRSNLVVALLLLAILGGALYLRLYDLDWDRGYLFHPDERQIIIVVDGLSFPWPPDWRLLLSPKSPWNPGFFAYGSFPIYLLRVSASAVGLLDMNYASLNLSYVVGRVLSALFDVGTVFLVYLLGRRLFNTATAFLGALFVTLAVLHIQLAHFYTVDTVLTFWVVLTVLLAVDLARQPTWRRGLAVGVAWGLALATKISAFPLLLPVAVAWFLGVTHTLGRGTLTYVPNVRPLSRWGVLSRALSGTILAGLLALCTFLLCQPYALLDPLTFLGDVVHEAFMARGLRDIPYTRQFIGTLPYLYPLQQMILWSMGLPLGLAGCAATIGMLGRGIKDVWQGAWLRAADAWIPLSWVLLYFGLTGAFHAKFLRYMLPLVPFLCLWAAWALVRLVEMSRTRWRASLALLLSALVLGGTLFYTLAFMNIYREEHPWIQATAWLCRTLPQGSTILGEHWDDPLPLLQGTGDLRCYRKHAVSELEAYNPDDTAKLEHILQSLEANQYIVLSSNRLYDTIPRLPERYPLTSRYYKLLMGEQLGFELVYYATAEPEFLGVRIVSDTFVDPRLPRPRLLAEQEAKQRRIDLGRADESFTVYDHPMPLVFKKTRSLSRQELLELLGPATQNLPPPGEGKPD
jgi:hypothetical protein